MFYYKEAYIAKKKIYIAKLRTNSHELHSEIGRWITPKHHGKNKL
jgi:hypothetical protein